MKIMLLFLFAAFVLNAQTDLPQRRNSGYEGKHFIVGFMQNENGELGSSGYIFRADQKIYITAKNGANVTCVFNGLDPVNVSIPVNGYSIVSVPNNFENVDSETLTNKSIEIFSDNPVIVNCYSSKQTTSDIYCAIPVVNLGTEYYAVTMPDDFYYMAAGELYSDLQPQDAAPRSGEFLIIASEDNTNVEITPTCQTQLLKQQFIPFNITMSKGQSYLVKSYSYLSIDIKGKFDLTGSKVKSNKPIAFISGHVRTAITQKLTDKGDSKNHLCEMLPSTDTWGTKYFSAPFFQGLSDYFKIVSLLPNTNITLTKASGISQLSLNGSGDYIVHITDEPTYWSSNKPFMIAQMMCRMGTVNEPSDYDPSMSILPALDQFVQYINFVTPRNSISNYTQYTGHGVVILANTKAKNSLTLDGINVNKTYNFINWGNPLDSLHWVRIVVQPGYHNLKADSGRFSGLMFGRGGADAYSTALGSYLVNSNLVDLSSPIIKTKNNCFNINGIITDSSKSDLGFGSIELNNLLSKNFNCLINKFNDGDKVVSFTATPIDYTNDGTFTIDYYDRYGNGKRYQEEFVGVKIVSNPIIDFGNIKFDSISTKELKIFNNSKRDIILDSISFFKDSRLSFSTKVFYPLLIPSKDSLVFNVNFNTKDNFNSLIDTVKIYSECIIKNVVLKGVVSKASLYTLDYNFGDVLLGDTICSPIFWINNGNTNVTISSITFPKNSFFPDTIGYFPYNLAPGDTFKLDKVCFIPDSSGYFESNIKAENIQNIQNLARLTGFGVKPLFNDLIVDWQKKRVGTVNDTIMTISNKGKHSGTISLINIFKEKNLTNNSSNRDTLATIKDLYFDMDQSKNFKFQFSPKYLDTNGYEIQAKYNSTWKLSPDYSISLYGLGTIPQIKTENVDFDTIYVNQEKTILNKTIIKAGGNEDLTIDSIIPVFGDIASFEINPIYFNKNVIKLFDQFQIPIKFKPTRVGEHKMLLAIINDAMPNYNRKVDSVWIRGFAVNVFPPTIDVTFATDSLLACQLSPVYININNFNDYALTINNIDNNTFGTFYKSDSIKYPFIIPAQSALNIKLFVLAERNKLVKIETKVFCQYQKRDYINNVDLNIDTLIQNNITFLPKVNKITIDKQDSLYIYDIGSEMELAIKGGFPNYIDTLTNFAFNLSYNRINFYPLQTSTKLAIVDKNNEYLFDVDVIKNDTMLIFKPVNCKFLVKNGMNWKIKIKFLVLLDTYLNPVFNANVSSEICFNPENQIIFTQINKICSFNLRPVEILSNLPFVDVSPNPIYNFLNVKFAIPGDDEVEIFATNVLGESFKLFDRKSYKSGTFSLKLENISLSNGFYVLNLKTKNFNMQTNFVIYK